MGINIGILFGLVAGGWLNEYFGWRWAFIVVGLPGLALAVLVRWTIREPQRGISEGVTVDEPPEPTREVFRFLWSLRSFRHLALASGLHAFSGYGLATWAPTFLRRVHALSAAEAGTYLRLIIGLGGAVGAVLGGLLADRLSLRDKRWYLWLSALTSISLVPFVLAFLLFDSLGLALIAYIPAAVLSAMWLVAILATTQALVKLRMRAVASAILFFIINLIGLGFGPQAVGIVNDLLAPSLGDEAIRYSLVLSILMTVWAAVHFALAARTLQADLQAKNA